MMKAVQLLKTRLSRRIVFWVFVCVIVIEAIILIPSYMRREKELLANLRMISNAKLEVFLGLTPSDASGELLFEELKQLMDCITIEGVLLLRTSGETVGSYGEVPELTLTEILESGMVNRKSNDGLRYDSAWTTNELKKDYMLILRQNAEVVRQELHAFIFRIGGLVIIISFFVTAGAWIALRPIVVRPILDLRKDLINAGEAVIQNRETPHFNTATLKRQDELGEVIGAFNQMYRKISEAIAERKQAEEALQYSLNEVEAYSKAMNRELEKGRQMQNNFLPAELFNKPGWEMVAFFRPARQVSGDFYDIFELPDNNIGLVIADVCDKGVGAALFMALFRSLIRIFSGQTALNGLACMLSEPLANPGAPKPDIAKLNPAHLDALKAVQLTNDYIAQNHGDLGMFATLFFGVLNVDAGDFTYINAGHDPVYIIDSTASLKQSLGPTSPVVGVQTEVNFEIRQAQLDKGDIMLGYTDGIPEARAEDGQFFTKGRLLNLVETPVASAAELVERIADELKRHIGSAEQHDDITLLAVKWENKQES